MTTLMKMIWEPDSSWGIVNFTRLKTIHSDTGEVVQNSGFFQQFWRVDKHPCGETRWTVLIFNP